MNGASWKRTLIACLIGLFAIILISCVIEGIAIRREIGEMETATQVAANGALISFQNLDFGTGSEANGGVVTRIVNTIFGRGNYSGGYAYTAGVFDIKKPLLFWEYKTYLDSLEMAAKDELNNIGYSNSDISFIIEQLRNSAKEYALGRKKYCYTPMQFGYSFLDLSTLEKIFGDDLSAIVAANYHQDTSKGTNMFNLAFSGMDRVRCTGVDVKFIKNGRPVEYNAPILIAGHDDIKSMASIFGSDYSTRETLLKMTGAHEQFNQREYNYIIAYDVKFIVHWEHATITPFFRNWNFVQDGPRIRNEDLNENGQLVIKMNDIEYAKRYILTN